MLRFPPVGDLDLGLPLTDALATELFQTLMSDRAYAEAVGRPSVQG